MSQTVVVDYRCDRCDAILAIACQRHQGTRVSTATYAIDCPGCGARLHPDLPSDIVDVYLKNHGKPVGSDE